MGPNEDQKDHVQPTKVDQSTLSFEVAEAGRDFQCCEASMGKLEFMQQRISHSCILLVF